MNEEMIDRLVSKALALQTRKVSYLSYLQTKIREEDWHGCFDCAADLRDLDTEIRQIEELIEMLRK